MELSFFTMPIHPLEKPISQSLREDREAFILADQVLYSGIACIVDLIVKDGLINLDFADVRTVMSGMGAAMMGTGEASGEQRAVAAAEEAIANPQNLGETVQ